MVDFSETLRGLDTRKLQHLVKAEGHSEELYQLRRLAWAKLLHVVKGEAITDWLEELSVHRRRYNDLVAQHQEELDVKKFDANIANPLSRNAANPFLKKQANDELLQEIWKDVERTYPEVPMLQEERSRKAMQQILFHWCKANNPAKDASESYRQGMNELAAVVYYAVRAGEYGGLASPATELCGSAHSEADTFTLFNNLMEAGLRDMFAVEKGAARPTAPAKSPIGELPVPRARAPAPSNSQPQTAILARCSFIFHVLLKNLDEPLHRRISQHGIEPQIFLLRWLRVLFCREFHLEDTLILWDAIFVDSFESQGIGSLKYATTGPATVKAEAASLALPLVDYIAVAMLKFLRQDLLGADESNCLQRLLKFPPVQSVRSFPELAQQLRSGAPAQGPGLGPSLLPPTEGSSMQSGSSSIAEPLNPGSVDSPTRGGYPQALPVGGNKAAIPSSQIAQPVARANNAPPGPGPGRSAAGASASSAGSGGGGLLDATKNLFDVGKQALIDAKQRVSLFAGSEGTGAGSAAATAPGSEGAASAAAGAGPRPGVLAQGAPGANPARQEEAGTASQLSELQKRLAAVEQERDTIKRKATEFVQAKKAEWNIKTTELEGKLEKSEARVKELEDLLTQAESSRQTEVAAEPVAKANPGELEDLREVVRLRGQFESTEERLAAAEARANSLEAEAAKALALREMLLHAEERLEAEQAQVQVLKAGTAATAAPVEASPMAAPLADTRAAITSAASAPMAEAGTAAAAAPGAASPMTSSLADTTAATASAASVPVAPEVPFEQLDTDGDSVLSRGEFAAVQGADVPEL